MVSRALIVSAVLLLSAACAYDELCPRGSMLESEGALIVTETEHRTGWGQANCEECHSFQTIHRLGCTPGVDLTEVRLRVEEEGRDACATCHGENGVMP